ncbi:MAG: hypothetical protein IH595_12370 [Bacteroidales bacterium]|nr:hypothetical protein [Bacteroidales bacterium]
MNVFKLWVIVGGTGRNIGKTTFSEILIKKLSRYSPVTGIKISNIKPEGLEFHGTHDHKSGEAFFIYEETRTDGNKDSIRFLKSGATKSYFVQTNDDFLPEAFQKLQDYMNGDEIVVCESNSLINIMKPAVFLMIKGESNKASKTYVEKSLKQADYVLDAMDLNQFEKVAEAIILRDRELKFLMGEK